VPRSQRPGESAWDVARREFEEETGHAAPDGPPIELVVYPGVYHGFYYSHFQPGTNLLGHWLEYNGAAVDDANHRLRQFLDHHLK